ncbi:DEAD/DEAH box helicase [Bradyrhizobium sp. SEMIA]|uniref:DEAD/DEAH box helicase n=1 Tax=Bradyrhizobium sp. SEMIA TaxID=2597515 RepID=UPI0018A510AD|nr:DEAD/DEAH box helicase [Bradyrhizobium sp. SEMIA]QOG23729.1 DEAD/DEAH box helicase [Bradyrhizobium sp. SEMIA]
MRRASAFDMERTRLLTSFQDFGLAEPIARALREENYVTPTPIQAQTIPLALTGRDVVGIAQTGTGKTASFALPILHRLLENRIKPQPKTARVLVLSPTRELSGQILDSFNAYGRHIRLSSTLAIGGVPMGRQVRSLMQGVDVLVATPGRLLDLVQSNGLKLSSVEFLVLDEADRMLDMGFINDIRKIVAKLPIKRQTLFFSATMPKDIAELADSMLRDPARVAVTPVSSTAERINQRILQVDFSAKPAFLTKLLKDEGYRTCSGLHGSRRPLSWAAPRRRNNDRPAGGRPGQRPQGARHGDGRRTDERHADGRHHSAGRQGEGRHVDGRPGEGRHVEGRPVDGRPGEGHKASKGSRRRRGSGGKMNSSPTDRSEQRPAHSAGKPDGIQGVAFLRRESRPAGRPNRNPHSH